MSLDTVIKIGKFYRQDKNAWKYHEQINSVMSDVNALSKNKDKDGNSISTIFYEIKVIDKGDSFSFDLDNMFEIHDEDKKNRLYYLNFKTSKKDAFKRYLLGDLVYSCYKNKKNELVESGNYRMNGIWADKIKNGVAEKKSSFWLSEEVEKTMDNIFISKFRTEFRNKAEQIEEILKNHTSVVLHFDFEGKRWLDIGGIIENIDTILTSGLVKNHTDNENVVLDKYFYKTLGGVTPGFTDAGIYKSRLFTKDEIVSLMYAGKAAEKPLIRFGNIGIIALPHSESLTPEMVVDFFERKSNTIEEEIQKEESVKAGLEILSDTDDIFAGFLDNNNFDKQVKFDIIFTSIPASPSGVFSDLIEIADVEKSLLEQIHTNIREQRIKIENLANSEFPNPKYPFRFQIRTSFMKILGDVTKDKKKYLSHLLKVLPKIYTDSYYEDPLLLPAFLEKVEYNVREGNQGFTTLKYDFYFLMNIQKNNTLMNITESKSYDLGKNLGIMARQFAAWRDDCPIKSFEKNYVGNLSRRTSSIDEVVKFADFLNNKLVMHGKHYKSVKQAFHNFNDLLASMGNEKYNKYNFSLGFFESYYEVKTEEQEKIEEIYN